MALLAGIIATRVQAEARAREQSFFKLQAVSTQNTIGLGKVISTTYAFAYGMFELFTAGPDTETIDQQDGSVAVVLDKDLDKDLSVEGEKEQKKKCDPENPVPLILREQKQKPHEDPTCRPHKTCFYSRAAGLDLMKVAWKEGLRVASPSSPDEIHKRYCGSLGANFGYYNGGSKPSLDCVLIRVNKQCKFRGYPEDRTRKIPPPGAFD